MLTRRLLEARSLVEFHPGKSPGFIAFAGMQMELSRILGRTVDLKTPADLSGYFRDEVLREARLLHAAQSARPFRGSVSLVHAGGVSA